MRNWYVKLNKQAQVESNIPVEPEVAPAVDMSAKPKRATQGEKKQWHNAIEQAIGTSSYFEQIPLGPMMEALKQFGVTTVQEDGTDWSGLFIGGAECGDPKASSQNAKLELARNGELVNAELYMTWCKMPSGSYEVVWYIT